MSKTNFSFYKVPDEEFNSTKRFAEAFRIAYDQALIGYCTFYIGDDYLQDIDNLLNNRGLFNRFFLKPKVEATLTSLIVNGVASMLERSVEDVEPDVRDYIDTHYYGGLPYIDNLWGHFNILWRHS